MTGLTTDQVDRLVLDVYAAGSLDPARRRVLGPYRAVLAVLLYLRHNLSQALIAELFGCSQPTVSRLVARLMPIITTVLSAYGFRCIVKYALTCTDPCPRNRVPLATRPTRLPCLQEIVQRPGEITPGTALCIAVGVPP